MTTIQDVAKLYKSGIIHVDEARELWAMVDEFEYTGVSGSSMEPYTPWYDKNAKHKWPSKEDRIYFRYVVCEFCNVRNPNNDETFYCVSCGGPLPI